MTQDLEMFRYEIKGNSDCLCLRVDGELQLLLSALAVFTGRVQARGSVT